MNDEIFKISKDKEREELLKIIPTDKAYTIIEEYYEIIKELLTALMYIDGYKTLSHVKLIDTLRKFRIGIVYYGKRISNEFLVNNDKEIKQIITHLIKLVKEKLSNTKSQ